MLQNPPIRTLSLALLFLFLAVTTQAAAPSPGADCSGDTANAYACYANGCFKCVSNAWTAQGLYIGQEGSTTCDSTHNAMLRWNNTSKLVEYCNGTSWKNLAQISSSLPQTGCGSTGTVSPQQSASITMTAGCTVTFKVWGGGGGGGGPASDSVAGGAGGGGGFAMITLSSIGSNTTYYMTVGGGGGAGTLRYGGAGGSGLPNHGGGAGGVATTGGGGGGGGASSSVWTGSMGGTAVVVAAGGPGGGGGSATSITGLDASPGGTSTGSATLTQGTDGNGQCVSQGGAGGAGGAGYRTASCTSSPCGGGAAGTCTGGVAPIPLMPIAVVLHLLVMEHLPEIPMIAIGRPMPAKVGLRPPQVPTVQSIIRLIKVS